MNTLTIHLTPKQHMMVEKGKAVRISADQLTGANIEGKQPILITVTPKLFNKMYRHSVAGKGLSLPAEIFHRAAVTAQNVYKALPKNTKADIQDLVKSVAHGDIKGAVKSGTKLAKQAEVAVENVNRFTGGRVAKGSEEAKQRMQRIRDMKKKKEIGGSFQPYGHH
jgi:hypothetical protein